jgi:hypothetical protein
MSEIKKDPGQIDEFTLKRMARHPNTFKVEDDPTAATEEYTTEEIDEIIRTRLPERLTNDHFEVEDEVIPLSFRNLKRVIKNNLGIDEVFYGTASLRKQLIGAGIGIAAVLAIAEGAPRAVHAVGNVLDSDSPEVEHVIPSTTK